MSEIKSDLDRVDKLKDEYIDFSDSPELTEEWFNKAKAVRPEDDKNTN